MAHTSRQERTAEQKGQQRDQGYQAKSQDAIHLIKTDHDLVEGLFTQFEEAKGQASQQEALARQIFQALEVHAQIEEELFYPVVRSKVYENGEDIIQESLQEHKTVKELIRQLRGLNPQDPTYMNAFQQLMDNVREHVDMEENEMLVDTEEQLGDELERLGAEMQRRKQELMSTIH
jgi:hemerythrin superfamily protein